MRLVIDLRGLERTLLLVWELQELMDAADARGEGETHGILGRALKRFCADGEEDRTGELPLLADIELHADDGGV